MLSCKYRIAAAELPDLPDTDFTLEQVREGDTLYHAQCSSCHGGIGIADGRHCCTRFTANVVGFAFPDANHRASRQSGSARHAGF